MHHRRLGRLPASGAGALLLIAVPVLADHAKTPPELRDLIGTPLEGSEYELLDRGFINIDRLTWWNEKTQTCLKLKVVKGSLAGLDKVPLKTCHLE